MASSIPIEGSLGPSKALRAIEGSQGHRRLSMGYPDQITSYPHPLILPLFHVEHSPPIVFIIRIILNEDQVQLSMLIIRIILKGGPTHAEEKLASLR
jgi:hypothetical protein